MPAAAQAAVAVDEDDEEPELSSLTKNDGEITFGGTDSSKFTGAINFAYVADPAPCRVDSRGGVC